jgi:hypothetical protein
MNIKTIAAVAVAAAITLTGCSGGNTETIKPNPSAASEDASATQAQAVTPSPTQTDIHPTNSDFVMHLRITSKQCFGSAGCNIEYDVIPKWAGDQPAADTQLDGKYDLTYAVTGSEDGPIVETMTVYPTLKYEVPMFGGFASTSSSYAELEAHVVRLREHLGW